MKLSVRSLLPYLVISFTILAAPLSLATTIQLSDEPKTDAKIVGSVDTEVGIIPIFHPKKSAWIKVANPTNGQVGWIQTKSLNTSNSNTSGFTFTQKIINSSKSTPRSFQIIQYGGPAKMSPEQAQTMLKEMQLQQQIIQKDIQTMMKNMFKKSNLDWATAPLIVPIFVIPQSIESKSKEESFQINMPQTTITTTPVSNSH